MSHLDEDQIVFTDKPKPALPPVRSEPMLAALRALSSDMHQRSDRPCSTCRAVSLAISEPFGCYAYQAARGIKSDLQLSQANARPVRTDGPPRDSGTHEAVVGL